MGPLGTSPANGAPEARPDRRRTYLAPDRRLHAVQLQPGPRLPVDVQSPPGEVLQDQREPPRPGPNYGRVPRDIGATPRVQGHEQHAVRCVPDADRHREPVLPSGDGDGSGRLHIERAGHVLHALPPRDRIPQRDPDRELPADLHLRGRPRDRRGGRPPRPGCGRSLLGIPPVRGQSKLAARDGRRSPTASMALREWMEAPNRRGARPSSPRAASVRRHLPFLAFIGAFTVYCAYLQFYLTDVLSRLYLVRIFFQVAIAAAVIASIRNLVGVRTLGMFASVIIALVVSFVVITQDPLVNFVMLNPLTWVLLVLINWFLGTRVRFRLSERFRFGGVSRHTMGDGPIRGDFGDDVLTMNVRNREFVR